MQQFKNVEIELFKTEIESQLIYMKSIYPSLRFGQLYRYMCWSF